MSAEAVAEDQELQGKLARSLSKQGSPLLSTTRKVLRVILNPWHNVTGCPHVKKLVLKASHIASRALEETSYTTYPMLICVLILVVYRQYIFLSYSITSDNVSKEYLKSACQASLASW